MNACLFLTPRYLREYQSLGTGGGLYHFRDQIMRGGTDAFFVIHADVVSSFPLTDIVAFHTQHQGKCTIMGTKVSSNAIGHIMKHTIGHDPRYDESTWSCRYIATMPIDTDVW